MKTLKQCKIVVIIATIFFVQTPQLCKAEYTLQEISREATKRLILGICATTSCVFIYQGAKQFFFPPILCKSRIIQAKLDENASLTERVNKPPTIEHLFDYTDTTYKQQKKGLLFAALGATGLTASWFANKYS